MTLLSVPHLFQLHSSCLLLDRRPKELGIFWIFEWSLLFLLNVQANQPDWLFSVYLQKLQQSLGQEILFVNYKDAINRKIINKVSQRKLSISELQWTVADSGFPRGRGASLAPPRSATDQVVVLKVHSHHTKAKAKAKIFFDVWNFSLIYFTCSLVFFRFRIRFCSVWMGLYVLRMTRLMTITHLRRHDLHVAWWFGVWWQLFRNVWCFLRIRRFLVCFIWENHEEDFFLKKE